MTYFGVEIVWEARQEVYVKAEDQAEALRIAKEAADFSDADDADIADSVAYEVRRVPGGEVVYLADGSTEEDDE